MDGFCTLLCSRDRCRASIGRRKCRVGLLNVFLHAASRFGILCIALLLGSVECTVTGGFFLLVCCMPRDDWRSIEESEGKERWSQQYACLHLGYFSSL